MTGIKKEKDVILQLLIETVNEYDDYDVPITLNVNGAIVSGTLLSAEAYFKEALEMFDDDTEADNHIYEKLEKATEQLTSGEEPEINYIHLKDAKMFDASGSAVPSKGSVMWRGKLKEVDGFFVGKLKES
ncbi:gas vesicle accessory protein GvpU [Alkalicoccus halolimnae]|uniref:Gas vesicle accessory protein GvpU n=1 Tax=Alkalicoccus halolimnae TaxID=1667239 RepID=A0A5C7FCQ3_9BACI|nr:gas vesicle accessory protein GvpU [Alkalicoccus halolimnae]TXF85127.1 gas vesicle protein GvpU [Alkalicoccus halolimnae]